MLNALKKMVGNQEPGAEMQALTAEYNSYKETAEALMAEAEAKVAEKDAAIAALQAQLQEYAAVAAQQKAAAELAAEEAKAMKAKARKDKIEAAVGTDKAPALLAALEPLGDEQFEAVVSGLAASVDTEAASPLFAEQGAAGQIDEAKLNEKPSFKQFLPKKK